MKRLLAFLLLSALPIAAQTIVIRPPQIFAGSNPAQVDLIIRGAASQTADLQQWQDSTATVLSRITAAGAFSGPVILAAFTPGSVLFAGASGTITEDNANLFWDDATNRLGIGTATPVSIFEALTAANSATEILSITVDPVTPANNDEAQIAFRLDPSGAGVVQTFGRIDVALLDVTGGAERSALGLDVWDSDGAGTMIEGFNLIGQTGQDEAVINTNQVDLDFRVAAIGAANALFVRGSDGNVGVGTATPATLLHMESTSNPAFTIRENLLGVAGSLRTLNIINFEGLDTASAVVQFAVININSQDATAGAEDGSIYFRTMDDGTLGTDMTIRERNVGIGVTTLTSRLDVAGNIEVGSVDSFFYGDPTTDTTWKTVRSGTKLSFQRREVGVFVEKGFFDTSFHSTKIVLESDGTAGAPAISFASDPDTGIFLKSANVISLVSGGVERMSIDTAGKATMAGDLEIGTMTTGSVPFFGASGLVSQDNANLFWHDTNNRLGIGTSAPDNKLSIVGTPNALADLAVEQNYHLKIQNANDLDGEGVGISFGMSSTDDQQTAAIVAKRTGGNGQGALQFYTKQSTLTGVAPVLVLALSESGNVGISISSPIIGLAIGDADTGFDQVSDGVLRWMTNNGERMRIDATGKVGFPNLLGSDSNDRILCYKRTGGNVVGEITFSGDVTDCNPSSLRYKTKVEDLDVGLNELMELRPVRFEFKEKPGLTRMGLIAEEVYQTSLAELVNFNEAGEIESLKKRFLPIIIIKAIQEQQKQIEELKRRILQLALLRGAS